MRLRTKQRQDLLEQLPEVEVNRGVVHGAVEEDEVAELQSPLHELQAQQQQEQQWQEQLRQEQLWQEQLQQEQMWQEQLQQE